MAIALITGASSGLGKEYIPAIIEQFPVVDEFWLIARRKENLKEIAEQYPEKTVAAISLDLQKPETFDLLSRLLRERSPDIKVLVNAAGYGQYTPFYASDVSKQAGMVSLNCTALTQVTRLCLPYMADESLIVNISSIAAFSPLPNMSVYAASKSFVLSFSKSLRKELRQRGINVIAVCPGPMETEFWDVAYFPTGSSKMLDSLPKVSAKAVAVGSLKKGRHGRAFYTKGAFYRFYHVLAKIVPHNWLIRFFEA